MSSLSRDTAAEKHRADPRIAASFAQEAALAAQETQVPGSGTSMAVKAHEPSPMLAIYLFMTADVGRGLHMRSPHSNVSSVPAWQPIYARP